MVQVRKIGQDLLNRASEQWLPGLLDAVLPVRCVLCGVGEPMGDLPLCERCDAWVDIATSNAYCTRCGATEPPYTGGAASCPSCARRSFPFDSVVRVGAYAGGLKAAIRSFKFGGREELDRYFADRMGQVIARSALYEDIDAIVAVPTCWQHRLRRAFHPALALGRLVAQRCRIPYAPLLERRGGGPHQTGLPLTTRMANVRGRFRMARGCSVPGACIVLVDDVMTSGATAAECTRVLRAAGADEIHVLVLARAGDDPVSLRHI